ncbi:hypothetical protein PPUN15366_16670 [Pseudomonas putida]|nr:hypothetical protein PPUN15366_16670 [Pseudomonas putida]
MQAFMLFAGIGASFKGVVTVWLGGNHIKMQLFPPLQTQRLDQGSRTKRAS